MMDSKTRALMEELKALQQQNQRLKDALSFQEATLRKQIRQKNKYYAAYLNLTEERKREPQFLNNSMLSDTPSQSKLMGSFRSTEPESIGKERPKLEKQKIGRVKFSELQIIVDQGEVKSVTGKSMEKSVSQNGGYTTLKELRQMQQNSEVIGNGILTPLSTSGKKKKSYFEKLAEQNST